MSTNYNINRINPNMRRRQAIRRKRILRTILLSSLICGTVATSFGYHKKVQALNEQINTLNRQIAAATELYEESVDNLTKAEQELEALKERLEADVIAEPTQASAPIYNLPLNAALQQYTYDMCVDYGISEHYEFVLAMMWQESNYTVNIISSTDDYGLMQINKVNHQWLGETLGVTNFLDAEQNIHAGVYLISNFIHKYGDTNKALMAYGLGEYGASKYWDSGVYKTTYCDSINAKCAAIKLDNYWG